MTPNGSFHTARRLSMPIMFPSGRSRSQANSSIIFAGQRSASSSGQSSWAAKVIIRGVPTSAISSSRYSSRSDSSASCSCSRQRLRRARLVDQSDSSKARRAAAIARCMSSVAASATSPSTSSVAGLMFSNRLPEAASTSSPSMSMRTSPGVPWVVIACAPSLSLYFRYRSRDYEAPARAVKAATWVSAPPGRRGGGAPGGRPRNSGPQCRFRRGPFDALPE